MKIHVPTFELMIMVEEIKVFLDAARDQLTRQLWIDELVEIDAELDTRAPTEQFCTLVDEVGQLVGFEQMEG